MFAGAIVLSDGSIALAATLVLPPALSLLSVRFALRHDETNNAAQWIRYGSQVYCFSKRNGTRPRAATSNRMDSISPREVGLFGITLLLARHIVAISPGRDPTGGRCEA